MRFDTQNSVDQTFMFKTKLFNGFKQMSLSEIKDFIAKDARKRLTQNWWFTNRTVHNATIAAINLYNELANKEKYHEVMQDILISHGNYLYSPFYWNTKKHLLLVDGFMHEAANKRLPTTLLDIDTHSSDNKFSTGVLFGALLKSAHKKNSKK